MWLFFREISYYVFLKKMSKPKWKVEISFFKQFPHLHSTTIIRIEVSDFHVPIGYYSFCLWVLMIFTKI